MLPDAPDEQRQKYDSAARTSAGRTPPGRRRPSQEAWRRSGTRTGRPGGRQGTGARQGGRGPGRPGRDASGQDREVALRRRPQARPTGPPLRPPQAAPPPGRARRPEGRGRATGRASAPATARVGRRFGMATLRLWAGAPQRPPARRVGDVASTPVWQPAQDCRSVAGRESAPRASRGPACLAAAVGLRPSLSGRDRGCNESSDYRTACRSASSSRSGGRVAAPFGIRPEREGPPRRRQGYRRDARGSGPTVPHPGALRRPHGGPRGGPRLPAGAGTPTFSTARPAGAPGSTAAGASSSPKPATSTISDPNLPYATRAQEGFAFDFWVLPRAEIDRHLPRPAGRRSRSTSPAGFP